jgi:hypothetical protein
MSKVWKLGKCSSVRNCLYWSSAGNKIGKERTKNNVKIDV